MNENLPLISVIIPVYNVERYLRKCLDSVISQSYTNLEIILVDDGSTDGSGAICDNYGTLDSRIVVIHQQNMGLSGARNAGLDCARGQWIAFIDSDDYIDKDMYKVLYQVGSKNNADICACKSVNVDLKGNVLDEKEYTGAITIMDSDKAIASLGDDDVVRFEVWNKLWKKEIIGNTHFKLGQVSEDIYFTLEIFSRMKVYVDVDFPYHNYLYSREGNTNSSFKIKRMCVFDEIDAFIDKFKSEGKKQLCVTLANIGVSTAMRMYEEAYVRQQDKLILKKLYTLFCKYFKYCLGENRYLLKSLIFFISPKLCLNLAFAKRKRNESNDK